MTVTNIYHISFRKSDASLYIWFKGCNFKCKYCLRKKVPWSFRELEEIDKLPSPSSVRTLKLNEVRNISNIIDAKRVNLGGFEPTCDPHLREIIEIFASKGCYVIMTTNGHLLNKEYAKVLIKSGLKEIVMSIKAYSDAIFQYYTGVSNEKVLNNFQEISKLEVNLIAETVLIPGLVDVSEIERIAKFISFVNPEIPLRIDALEPINEGMHGPNTNELKDAKRAAQKFLKKVFYIPKETNIIGKKGEVITIYPNLMR
ncbi:MAG: radical SAM protein [Nitrososphaeria archaeon]